MISVFPDQALKSRSWEEQRASRFFARHGVIPRHQGKWSCRHSSVGEQRIRNAKVVGSTPIAGTRIPGKSSRQAAFRCVRHRRQRALTRAATRQGLPPQRRPPFPKRRNNAATALPGTRARSRASNLLDSIPPHTAHAHPARRRRHHDRRKRARLRAEHYAADWVRTATPPTWPCAPAPMTLSCWTSACPTRRPDAAARAARPQGPHAGPDRHRPRRRRRPHRGTGRGRGRLHRQTL